MVGRGALAAAFVAAVLFPVASASGASQIKLALLPLPKAALGPTGHSLSLAPDSGVDSNERSASQATGSVTAARLERLGRISGYLLDYGTPFSDSPAVSEVQTEVEHYRTPAAAGKGLVFWRKQERDVRALKQFGLRVSFQKVVLPHAPRLNWAYLTIGRIRGLKPIYGVDAQMVEGAYLLDVSIAAGSSAAAKRLVPVIAQKFDQRFRLARQGRLHGEHFKLSRPKPGPPAHGPKPSRIVLTRGDAGSPATIRHAGYVSSRDAFDEYAISAYDLALAPAGSSYDELAQEVSVAGSALEVKYFAALAAGLLAHGPGTATRVSLSEVGDNAFGSSSRSRPAATPHPRRSSCFIVAAAAAKLSASDVQSLAQKAAHRLDVAVAG
jgi:hypothetical protein